MEKDGGIGPNHFPLFENVGAAIWRWAQYLGPFLEAVLPQGNPLLQEGRRLGKMLGVQRAPILVHLDGDPCREA